MGNGTLVFIILILAIVIVWQASKLKQFAKVERLLNSGAGAGSATADTSALAQEASQAAKPSSIAAQASQSVAGSLSANNSDDDPLDMEGVDPEGNIEEAKRVQLVMARCHYAEFYLEQLDDDYERDQFQRIVNSCKNTALNIPDPFFRSSALQPLILLLDKAEWTQERDELIAEVDDELVKQQLSDKLSA